MENILFEHKLSALLKHGTTHCKNELLHRFMDYCELEGYRVYSVNLSGSDKRVTVVLEQF